MYQYWPEVDNGNQYGTDLAEERGGAPIISFEWGKVMGGD